MTVRGAVAWASCPRYRGHLALVRPSAGRPADGGRDARTTKARGSGRDDLVTHG
jgi:hypothetical protein